MSPVCRSRARIRSYITDRGRGWSGGIGSEKLAALRPRWHKLSKSTALENPLFVCAYSTRNCLSKTRELLPRFSLSLSRFLALSLRCSVARFRPASKPGYIRVYRFSRGFLSLARLFPFLSLYFARISLGFCKNVPAGLAARVISFHDTPLSKRKGKKLPRGRPVSALPLPDGAL